MLQSAAFSSSASSGTLRTAQEAVNLAIHIRSLFNPISIRIRRGRPGLMQPARDARFVAALGVARVTGDPRRYFTGAIHWRIPAGRIDRTRLQAIGGSSHVC